MEQDRNLKDILKEVSNAISRSLSTPEILGKLEKLHDQGYQLYLIMEPKGDGMRNSENSPIMPITVSTGSKKNVKEKSSNAFDLNEGDRDFLKTLKIKVD